MNLIELTVLLSFSYITKAFISFGIENDNHNRIIESQLNAFMGSFDNSTISTKWIQQPIDHFAQNDTRSWKMQYLERLDFWKPKGPVYLCINGDWTLEKELLQNGTMYDLAKETNGAMYASEHRYYGESRPFEELTTENFAYLSSKQGLADLAKLLKSIKENPLFNESKVVVVGFMYAGNLAAWMRLKYPDLVDAAIASSAPVLAKKEFYECLENVGVAFEQYGSKKCYDKINEKFTRYQELFKTSAGIAQFMKEENICNETDMSKPINQQLFFNVQASGFIDAARYYATKNIKLVCDELLNSSNNHLIVPTSDFWPIKNKGRVWNDDWCYGYDFEAYVSLLKKTSRLFPSYYQTCTEFGDFTTTSPNNHPFTDNIPMELFYRFCASLFGPEFNEARIDKGIERTNNLYGGLNPNVTNVIFVNGDIDPYRVLGVLEDLSNNTPAIRIPNVAAFQELLPETPTDPEELKEARKRIKKYIKKWIGVVDYKN